jgi:ferritin
MISAKMQGELNQQINAELYSAYLYLSMSAYYQSENLPGLANWMKVQASEEVEHAMKFVGYLEERGGRVLLAQVTAPPAEWAAPAAPFQDAYAHEVSVTTRIHHLVALARDEKDYATESFLTWFVDEQVEEEAAADLIVKQFAMIGGSTGALFQLDHHLGKRGA